MKNQIVIVAVLVFVAFVSCEDPLPEINPEINKFRCKVDGVDFVPEYTFAKGVRETGSGYEILAGKKRDDLEIGDGITMAFPDTLKVGTFTLGGIVDPVTSRVSYIAKITNGNNVLYSSRGSITISELTDDRIKGTFFFSVDDDPTFTGHQITDGTFDLQVITY